jgi:predicted nucleic acid-binding protein
MTQIVVLDSGPLGLVLHPRATPDAEDCREWLLSLLDRAARVVIPAIVDYEIRREFLRADKTASIRRLDRLINTSHFEPLTTDALRLAAQFWADARKQGRATTSDLRLDADVILAAQARLFPSLPGDDVVVATTNARHLSLFVPAQDWTLIQAQ